MVLLRICCCCTTKKAERLPLSRTVLEKKKILFPVEDEDGYPHHVCVPPKVWSHTEQFGLAACTAAAAVFSTRTPAAFV